MALPDGRIQIRFLPGKSITPYGANDTPAFRPAFSHELVARGVAEYVDPADGPKHTPDPRFQPADELESNMLREVARIRQTRTLSGTEADIIGVTSGDLRWSRTLKEVKR